MRTAFYISDGTAITSEVFGHATLSLFPVEFNHKTIPFVETETKAQEVKELINPLGNKEIFDYDKLGNLIGNCRRYARRLFCRQARNFPKCSWY